MRAAIIFGLGSSEKDLKPFQSSPGTSWVTGLPANSSELDAIVILGGDGTVHRHLGQLVKLQLPVLVVPCGSGNDFARALKLRSANESLAAWRKFSSGGGNAHAIDLGIITALSHPKASQTSLPQKHYFCCVGGVGLDGEVARRANQLPRWLRGHGGYVLSFPPALFSFAPVPMKISVGADEPPAAFVTRAQKPTVLAAFANAPVFGGGMKIAPQARLDDGQLDVCLIAGIGKLKLFCLFPTVYFGKHLRIPEVEYFQANRLRIETEKPCAVYADGEYVCRTPVEISVAARVLRVIVP